jgi:lipoprotein
VKKLIVLLAAVGLFASCSKEEPIAPATQNSQGQEAPIALTGEEAAEGQIRLSLEMEVDNFDQIAGGFEEGQKARAVIPQVNTGGADGRLIDLRAYVDEKSDRLTGMLFVYDTKTGDYVPFNAPFRVYKDGKAIGYDGLVSGFKPGSGYRKAFDRMVAKEMRDCYVTAVIGNDPGNLTFTNKGPHVIQSWDDKVQLPANFVMLKSQANPLAWRKTKGGKVHEISLQGNGRMKLSMIGYLMMLRVQNEFPQYVLRLNATSNTTNLAPYRDANGKFNRVERPPFMAYLDMSPTLSAARDPELAFQPGRGGILVKSGSVEKRHYNAKSRNVIDPNRLEEYDYLQFANIIHFPVSRAQAGALPAKGDVVVAMYFPQANDYGTIGIDIAGPYCYDRSVFSRTPDAGAPRYYGLKNTNALRNLRKVRPSRQIGSTDAYSKSLENRVYYPVIRVQPEAFTSPQSIRNAEFNQYQHWTNNLAKWEAIP